MARRLQRLDVLRDIDLGNSVAEFDESLEHYFIETDTFRRLVSNRVDIVAGDKGTGKTALFRILRARYTELEELGHVEVVPAFNLSGSPIFQRLNEGDAMDEDQYSTLWKSFIAALSGNWILNFYEDLWTPKMKRLNTLLLRAGLRSADESASTIFSTVINMFRRIRHPKSIEATMTISPEGIPIVAPRVEFGDAQSEDDQLEPSATLIPHDLIFTLLEEILAEADLSLWLALDRLDEAFAGRPEAEIPALRALFRTYLDLQPFEHVRLKLFVRKDLFRRIIAGGFVNLTHVNARKVEIVWDDDSLFHLLGRRLGENETLGRLAQEVEGESLSEQLFQTVFPEQVDPGDRKPKTFKWIMGRIRDGNDVRPPRNLIDLVQKSQEAAVRREERERREFSGPPLITSDSLKAGLRAVSKQRVEDTLLAEAGDQALVVERFRGSKAEHNLATLAQLLDAEGTELEAQVTFLKDIGFLEPVGSAFKIPILYRDGLNITQGRAFLAAVAGKDED